MVGDVVSFDATDDREHAELLLREAGTISAYCRLTCGWRERGVCTDPDHCTCPCGHEHAMGVRVEPLWEGFDSGGRYPTALESVERRAHELDQAPGALDDAIWAAYETGETLGAIATAAGMGRAAVAARLAHMAAQWAADDRETPGEARLTDRERRAT